MAGRWHEVQFGAQLADLKEVEYRNTLAIASLLELLIAKGVVTAAEVRAKSLQLDRQAEAEVAHRFRPVAD